MAKQKKSAEEAKPQYIVAGTIVQFYHTETSAYWHPRQYSSYHLVTSIGKSGKKEGERGYERLVLDPVAPICELSAIHFMEHLYVERMAPYMGWDLRDTKKFVLQPGSLTLEAVKGLKDEWIQARKEQVGCGKVQQNHSDRIISMLNGCVKRELKKSQSENAKLVQNLMRSTVLYINNHNSCTHNTHQHNRWRT